MKLYIHGRRIVSIFRVVFDSWYSSGDWRSDIDEIRDQRMEDEEKKGRNQRKREEGKREPEGKIRKKTLRQSLFFLNDVVIEW